MTGQELWPPGDYGLKGWTHCAHPDQPPRLSRATLPLPAHWLVPGAPPEAGGGAGYPDEPRVFLERQKEAAQLSA